MLRKLVKERDHELNPKIQIGNKLQNLKRIKFDEPVKSRIPLKFVIPAEAGIQLFQ
jgi:hypothetical protein